MLREAIELITAQKTSTSGDLPFNHSGGIGLCWGILILIRQKNYQDWLFLRSRPPSMASLKNIEWVKQVWQPLHGLFWCHFPFHKQGHVWTKHDLLNLARFGHLLLNHFLSETLDKKTILIYFLKALINYFRALGGSKTSSFCPFILKLPLQNAKIWHKSPLLLTVLSIIEALTTLLSSCGSNPDF